MASLSVDAFIVRQSRLKWLGFIIKGLNRVIRISLLEIRKVSFVET
jgi:chemotaxis signal transduction protein